MLTHHSDLMATAASLHIYDKLHLAVNEWGPHTLPDFLDASEELTGKHQKPYQPYLKVNSFMRKRSFCSRLASSSQHWSLRVCAICGEGLDRAVQSQTRLVAWLTLLPRS